jgi:hypothetical protein
VKGDANAELHLADLIDDPTNEFILDEWSEDPECTGGVPVVSLDRARRTARQPRAMTKTGQSGPNGDPLGLLQTGDGLGGSR